MWAERLTIQRVDFADLRIENHEKKGVPMQGPPANQRLNESSHSSTLETFAKHIGDLSLTSQST